MSAPPCPIGEPGGPALPCNSRHRDGSAYSPARSRPPAPLLRSERPATTAPVPAAALAGPGMNKEYGL
jgi:hypothetical protein